jgi:hypothetical protein
MSDELHVPPVAELCESIHFSFYWTLNIVFHLNKKVSLCAKITIVDLIKAIVNRSKASFIDVFSD